MLKYEEYPAAIKRAEALLKNTSSPKMKRDLLKYVNRLKHEKKEFEKENRK